MSNTKKPSGLIIIRDSNEFICSWKRAQNYKKQVFQYRINEGDWIALDVEANAREKTITLQLSDYYPSTDKGNLLTVAFRVKGKASGKSFSKFTTSKDYSLKVPNKPTITATLDSTLTNRTTFEWETETSDSDEKWFNNNAYQTILVKDSAETEGGNLDWSSATLETKTASGSVNIDEDTALFDTEGYSYTRWVRMWSRGPNGDSGYSYAKHIYAMTNQAINVKASAKTNIQGGYTCVVSWDTTSNNKNPADMTIVQYAMVVPNAGLVCPAGASWIDANISIDTGATDSATFSIDDTLDNDQCLFVRVNTQHDSNITYGGAVLADVGVLKAPSNLSVTNIDDSTHQLTVNCTNNSDVPDSYIAIRYIPESDPQSGFICGIIPSGQSSVAAVQCPDWDDETTYNIEAYTVVGDYDIDTRAGNVLVYSIDEKMHSSTILKYGGAILSRPTDVTVSATNIPGTIRVTWDWGALDATGAELSWSEHEDAWESTDEPNTYIVDRTHKSAWNISGLETGQKWYVRVRLFKSSEDSTTYGLYSNTESIDLSSAPNIPTLVLSDSVITEHGSVTASWAYSTTDGSSQAYAEICEAEITPEGIEYGDPIAHTQTAQHITISADKAGWEVGNTYNLCVRVVSASGRVSDGWSAPVSVIVAEPLECEIIQTSLVSETITQDGVTRDIKSLKALPLTVTATGAGIGGITTIIVERAEDYHVDRPDETALDGYEGESIIVHSQIGESQATFDLENLIGNFDDGAAYRLIAVVQDGLGQSDSVSIDFEVHWTHQALMPTVTSSVDETNLVVFLTPSAPQEAVESDRCDIYRLSVDKPELIVQDAAFGTTYVDPYPTLGENGGHRVVFKTANGDYITEDGELAWVDTAQAGLITTLDYDLIDFDNNQIRLYFNTDLSNSWEKNFIQTQYLGGNVQGDWNPAVVRSGSIGTSVIVPLDQDMIKTIRDLADYPGICRVRTTDGSNYTADVQVSEDREHTDLQMKASYTFKITKVDSQELDGMTLAEWEEETEEEEES